jgi:hypothetical protein
MSTNETQVITAALEEVVKTFEEITTLTDASQAYEPNPGSMQRSSDTYWKTLQQNANVVEGKDISGVDPDGMLELSISGSMEDYSNIWRKIASHDMRDDRTLRNSMKAGAMALAGDMEMKGLAKAATHGSFCQQYANAPGEGLTNTSVWNALANAETRMFDSEMCTDAGVTAFLNGQTYTAGGNKLVDGAANRSNAIADSAYRDGLIQRQIAGISQVNRHNKLLRLDAAAATGVTVTGSQTFKPEATTPNPNGSSGNVDHRFAALTVSDTTDVKVGDKFTFPQVKAVALGTTKQVQDYDQTFTVAAVTDGTTLQISPKPISKADATLTPLEASYANIAIDIPAGAELNWLNTTATQSNIIMANDSLVLSTQPITVNSDIFQGLDAEAFDVGPIKGMLGFESNLGSLTGRYRMAIWYDWQVEKTESCGVMLFNQ